MNEIIVIPTGMPMNAYLAPFSIDYGKLKKASAVKRLLGSSASGQNIQEIKLGTGLQMVGDTLSATGGGGGGGTVTSVTATAPMASSGGATPNLSIPAASGSQSGYLTSSDFNSFNNKPSINRIMAHIAAY